MKTILVPTDFSAEANNALNFAQQVAEVLNTEIILLHVLEIPAGSWSVVGEVYPQSSYDQLYTKQLIDAAKARLDEHVQQLETLGVSARAEIAIGNPYINIQKSITDQHVDLIIMGSKGASGLSEIIVGSNAERVIRHAKCPVITVKAKTDLSAIKSMVLATDSSKEQDLIIPAIKEFQRMLGINLHLLRVCTPHNILTESHAKKQLKKFAKRNGLEDYTISTIKAVFADDGAIEFALQNNIQMVAIGTHGRTGIAHFFGGSIAEDLANHAFMPVLTVKISA